MKIPDTALEALEVLLQKDYPDTKFSIDEVRKIADNLVRTVKLVYTPLDNGKGEIR